MLGKGKSKSKSKKLLNDRDLKKYSKDSPGALDLHYYIMAKRNEEDKESDMVKAKIVDCRLRKGMDAKGTQLNKDSYEYYVHYVKTDRRLDCWVPPDWVKITDQYIETDPKKRKEAGDHDDEDDHHEGMDANERQAHEDATKIKTITRVKIGKYWANTWYYSPYPDEYQDKDCIFYCEYCLEFFSLETELHRHSERCKIVHPPGNQIYVDPEKKITMWEVDANRNMAYCENLSYLSKLFLDHKLLLYPIDLFLFFVLCEYDETGHHFVGYFSKNKTFANDYNLSCILTLPFYQKQGYGKFLMGFSYELSKIEKKIGTPERPLSDLGRKGYISFWTEKIIEYLNDAKKKGKEFSLDEMSKETAIRIDDIIETLETYNLIKKRDSKDPKDAKVYICADSSVLDEIFKQKVRRASMKVIKENIHWVPYYDPAKELTK